MASDILENLKSPDELKNMSYDELNELSSQLRSALINNVSNTGGHLASNLGVVELTVALHRVFSSPKDQIVFDVGHQCYVHKMLTGRYDRFSTLRQKDGLSGFPNPDESEHDIFKTGHSSTSISSALGLACAKSLAGDNDSSVVAVIGDGSMTGGLAYEGLNNAGHSGKNLVVILNDNKMSISQNVGAVSKMLTRLRSRSSYFRFKDRLGGFLIRIPGIGKPIYRRLNRMKSAIKAYFYSSNMFESMGFKYIGPIDGHDLKMLCRILVRAKSLKRPVLVHVKTKKGKGYSYAEHQPGVYHGIDIFDVNTGACSKSAGSTYSDVFGKTIVSLAEKDEKICVITAAMGHSCGLSEYMNRFPKRYFDVGIAEQHAVTFAGGLAKNGALPVFAVYSTFLQRSYDQIIHDVSLQKLKVVFAVDRAGIVGGDGATHQGLFDIPMILPIPGILIFAPSSASELQAMLTRAVCRENCASVVRYPRGVCVELPFKEPDKDWEMLDRSSKSAAVSYGREMSELTAGLDGVPVDVIKLNVINRFGEDLIGKLSSYERIIFFEECYKTGGVGMLLGAELNAHGFSGCYKIVAVDNEFVEHAPYEDVCKAYGLDSKSVRKAFGFGDAS